MPIKGQSPKETIHTEMHKFKHGSLHSGSKHGPLVTNRKQAIAIALSEVRRIGKRAEGGPVEEESPNPTAGLRRVYIGAPSPQVPISGAPEGYQPEPAKPVRPSILDYIQPGEDYQQALHEQANEYPAYLHEQGQENLTSGNPGKMLLGAGQEVLGTAMPAIAPVGAAFQAATKGIGRLAGPAAERMADVATFLTPGSAEKAVLAGLGFTPMAMKNLPKLNDAILKATEATAGQYNEVFKALKPHNPKDVAQAAFYLGLGPEDIEKLRAHLLPGAQANFDKNYQKMMNNISAQKKVVEQQKAAAVPVDLEKEIEELLKSQGKEKKSYSEFLKDLAQEKNGNPEFANKPIASNNDMAQRFGPESGGPVPPKPGAKPTLAESADGSQSKQDAEGLVKKYGDNYEKIAQEIYDTAEEVGPDYANSVVEHLPHSMKTNIGMAIDDIAEKKGFDPWVAPKDYDKEQAAYEKMQNEHLANEQAINEGNSKVKKEYYSTHHKDPWEPENVLHPSLTPHDLEEKADRLGLSVTAFHGTGRSFSEFKLPEEIGNHPEIGVHFGTLKAAIDRAAPVSKGDAKTIENRFRSGENIERRAATLVPLKDQFNVIPARIGAKKPLTLPDLGTWTPDRIRDGLIKRPEFTHQEVIQAMEVPQGHLVTHKWSVAEAQIKNLRKLIESKGFDSIVYRNNVEDPGSLSYIIWHPERARSFYAKFDPTKRHSRDLMAGIAGLSLVPLGLYGGMQAQAEEKATGGYVKKKHPQIDENPQEHEFIDFSRGGLIDSDIPGRTDKIPMKVSPGSYVLPADIPSALGQGNTKAGHEVLKKMFTHAPYGLPPPNIKSRPSHVKPLTFKNKADGGEADNVPIIAAGGEYIIHSDVVRHLGHGDMKKGHKLLDRFVIHTRKQHINTLRKLKPPK